MVQENTTTEIMAASALAGMVARIPTFPIDTIKAKLQVLTSASRQSAWNTARQTFRNQGWRGLYQGFGISFFGSAPASCLYFTSYELAKASLTSNSAFLATNPFLAHFVSGIVAETFSCVLWVPIDVVKERLQVQTPAEQRTLLRLSSSSSSSTPSSSASSSSPRYRGNIHALRTIMAEEGLRGVYRGYFATVASFGPFSALYLMTYEQMKIASNRILHRSDDEDPLFAMSLFSGAAAGAMASFLTNPLDLVKLRIQVQRAKDAAAAAAATAATYGPSTPASPGGGVAAPGNPTGHLHRHLQHAHPHASSASASASSAASSSSYDFRYRSVVDGLRKLYCSEGVAGLFRGATTRMTFHAPAAAITIALFEKFKSVFRHDDDDDVVGGGDVD